MGLLCEVRENLRKGLQKLCQPGLAGYTPRLYSLTVLGLHWHGLELCNHWFHTQHGLPRLDARSAVFTNS